MSANVHTPSRKPRPRTPLALSALLATSLLVALAGCGSSKSSSTTSETTSTPQTAATTGSTPTTSKGTSSGGASETVSLEANKEGQLEYNTKALTAKAGKVTIALANMSSLEHDVKVESASGQAVGGVEPFAGGSKSVSLNLQPGVYKFYCSVPGHRQAGMEGTLTVR